MQPAPDGEATGRDRLLRAALDYFAENGIQDASLRQIASAIGTSHRMLIYHFGSRDGLLTAVVEVLEAGERQILAEMMAQEGLDARARAWQFWTHVCDVGHVYGPLYYELASHAMRDDPNDALRVPNVQMWVDALAQMWSQGLGMDLAESRVQARLNLAVARGLLHDLLLTGDREAVDAAMARFDLLSFGTPRPEPAARKVGRKAP